MHRVELKDLNIVKGLPVSFLLVFLMHRVELKDIMSEKLEKDSLKFVPNAPCGVESRVVLTLQFLPNFGS